MNDLDMLKDLRRSTPEITTAASSAARARLSAEWTGAPRDARRPRTVIVHRWSVPRPLIRAVLTGTLAITLAVGIGVAQNVGEPHRGARPGNSIADASVLADHAARAVEHAPYTTPRPDQWIYVKNQAAQFKGTMSTWWLGDDIGNMKVSEKWDRADGRLPRAIRLDNGRLQFSGPDCRDVRGKGVGCGIPVSESNMYLLVKALPTEPGALLRALYDPRIMSPFLGGTGSRRPGPPRRAPSDHAVFETIARLLPLPLPPRLRAALYRVLPRIPGVSAQPNVKDAAGRRGVAFANTFFGWERQMIILAPGTYRFLGTYNYAIRDHMVGRGAGTVKKGTVTGLTTQLDQRIVDKPGATR